MGLRTKLLEREMETLSIVELADAHCHLDLIKDSAVIKDSIAYGVGTMITNGVDTASNARSVELADNTHIFAALGIDPEHAASVSDEELEFNIGIIRSNARSIVAIGEIGLDYKKATSASGKERQMRVFERFLDLAEELRMPVSMHSRGALDDVIKTVSAHSLDHVHIHFFEGDAEQVKAVEELGCMISVPPVESSKRARAIKAVGIERIMAESDSPIVGAAPRDIEKSVRSVALTQNTKNFFGIGTKSKLRR